MAYIYYNPNPSGQRTGDCVIRAVAKATDIDWERSYINLALQGYIMYDLPSSNRVWGNYLESKGFKKRYLPDICPDCYTVKDFCKDYSKGTYVLATGSHAIAVIDGNYYDVWDSGDEIPLYYYKKETRE